MGTARAKSQFCKGSFGFLLSWLAYRTLILRGFPLLEGVILHCTLLPLAAGQWKFGPVRCPVAGQGPKRAGLPAYRFKKTSLWGPERSPCTVFLNSFNSPCASSLSPFVPFRFSLRAWLGCASSAKAPS